MKPHVQKKPVSAEEHQKMIRNNGDRGTHTERSKQTQHRQICQRSGKFSADHGRAESKIPEGVVMFSKYDV